MTKQKRRQFLGKLSALGLGSLLPIKNVLNATEHGDAVAAVCTVWPSETRGPYPLFEANTIAAQTALVRSDIRETQTGVPLNLTITVQNTACTPIPNAKVYIWSCSKGGLYSGYSNTNNPGQAGLTYLRGIQTTDVNGQVNFTTIYPGWYMGRLTHIHAEVYVGNVLILTSQFAFPLDSVAGSATALVNAANGQGNNTITSYSGDNVFVDGYATQLLSLTGSVAAGYSAAPTFIINYTITPLNIISFTAGVENKNPMLWWITANEVNVDGFEIEQSTHPTKNYETLGKLKARNTSSQNNYSFSLPNYLPAEIMYYRLKITDLDGKTYYSNVATLHLETINKLKLVNTYVTNELLIKHPATYTNTTAKIISLEGKLMATAKLKEGITYTKIDVGFLHNGTYVLIIENGIDKLSTKFYKTH